MKETEETAHPELACSTEGSGETEADSGMQVDNGNNSNEENLDQDNEPSSGADPALNTNYDSCDGAIPVHRCDRCDSYETLSRAALLTHLSQCQGNGEGETVRHHRKMFECDVCNMKFSNGANMRRHKMRHTGVKPYECRVCQKRFFRKDHLAEHFTTHTKTLPYHCPICNKGFQRQIAMRAHFQNEHVGQHDMIKSCPLCSYRAGSMKSLRVHFFNRHGIDLDNPGPNLVSGGSLLDSSNTGGCSDSGDSNGARSADNATPPMHFLTPHVEISMTDTPPTSSYSPTPMRDQTTPNCLSVIGEPVPRINGVVSGGGMTPREGSAVGTGECPGSPQSADSNSNAPSSSLRAEQEVNPITPSVSLIPIKQEPEEDKRLNGPVNLSNPRNGEPAVRLQTATSSSLTSLIKVSPLKSLLRDDLKRRGTGITLGRARPESSPPNPSSSSSITNETLPSESSIWRCPSLKRSSTSLQCVFCGIGFPDQTLYFLHKGCHSDSNPWKCNICGEQCCNVYEFNSHLLSKTHQ
uniref:C2H2-type domain-containing protein n=1 Tax=Clastoptera arizonana TaxID=38151 RepID=A0A1B6CBA8_9HEMI